MMFQTTQIQQACLVQNERKEATLPLLYQGVNCKTVF